MWRDSRNSNLARAHGSGIQVRTGRCFSLAGIQVLRAGPLTRYSRAAPLVRTNAPSQARSFVSLSPGSYVRLLQSRRWSHATLRSPRRANARQRWSRRAGQRQFPTPPTCLVVVIRWHTTVSVTILAICFCRGGATETNCAWARMHPHGCV